MLEFCRFFLKCETHTIDERKRDKKNIDDVAFACNRVSQITGEHVETFFIYNIEIERDRKKNYIDSMVNMSSAATLQQEPTSRSNDVNKLNERKKSRKKLSIRD